jgi:glycosyltransferase involved in cell wall biosynthesis
MNILFVHQNFPGQYLHLARRLGADPAHKVVFITQRTDTALRGVTKAVYKPKRQSTKQLHHYLRETEEGVLNAQEVARVALELKKSGFVPDVMLGHNGWGEIWYLKEVFPTTPLVGYFEFFYRLHGADVGFDGAPLIFDAGPRVRTKNLGNLLALDAVDLGQCATQWQKSLYPKRYHPILRVIHEGIDTNLVQPNPTARLRLPDSAVELSRDDEVVTYVARNLEPYRGFPSFMRSLPAVLERRPKAHIVIVGGDETSYGPRLPDKKTFRQLMLDELGSALDLTRIHFLGKVAYPTFLSILQVSRVHVYLTFPFVLSWSLLEAMAAGCLVVASNTEPVREVIQDGENGILVDFFAFAQIAEWVTEALQNPHAYDRLRENARRTIVERYDLNTICLPAQLGMLQEITGNSRSRQGTRALSLV